MSEAQPRLKPHGQWGGGRSRDKLRNKEAGGWWYVVADRRGQEEGDAAMTGQPGPWRTSHQRAGHVWLSVCVLLLYHYFWLLTHAVVPVR